MSTVKANAIIDASGGNTATINSMTPTADSLQGFRNRIINGDMRIGQRNAGASVTINNTASYTLDRWYERCVGGAGSAVITVQRSSTAPTGFTNSKLLTVTTSKSPAVSEQFWGYQAIEGFNLADFGLGSASASTFKLSFWVRSSVTGTYSVAFQNSAQSRSYVATYTVNVANTFEYKTVTVTGDTTGTWLTDNGVGMYVFFDTGSGSNFNTTAGAWTAGTYYRTSGSVSLISNSGATFYITGVQLEVGSVATPFERRDYGRELILCQRYYYKTATISAGVISVGVFASTTTNFSAFGSFPVRLRTDPSALETSGSASDYQYNGTNTTICNAVPTFSTRTSKDMYQVNASVSSGLTAGQGSSFVTPTGNGYLAWSAEL
jgi:hypothetical protein